MQHYTNTKLYLVLIQFSKAFPWNFLLMLALSFASIIFYNSTTTLGKRSTHTLPPGPAGYPIVGCLPEMVKINKPILQWMHSYMQTCGIEIAYFRLDGIYQCFIKKRTLQIYFSLV